MVLEGVSKSGEHTKLTYQPYVEFLVTVDSANKMT